MQQAMICREDFCGSQLQLFDWCNHIALKKSDFAK